MRRSMKPCITTWPAYVPTLELESPEASSATAKASAAPPPISRSSPACAPSIVSIPVLPLAWNSDAATTSIVRLIAPGEAHRDRHVERWKRSSERRSPSSRGGIRPCTSALCR